MKAFQYKKLIYPILFLPVMLLFTASVNQDDRKENPDPSVQKQLESFKIADGFEVSLWAAEPLVVKPIQMNWDADGRLWVVSSTAYPHVKTGETANDKIFVIEDTDGDGKADKSTIFAEGLLTPTGILPGDGGVYVANSTEILHLMDTDGDGKADKRRKVLTGFGTADTHHLIHTFRWGPEGSMYFNQSIYIYSHVETPFGIRRLEGGGVWELRPKSLKLDVYAKGLVNPWGLQFDKWGQSFLTDGAGGEGINYAFPGATFVTAPGAERLIRGLNPGQPKHSGLEVISGRHLPESWLGSVITNDFRANRINRFKLEEQGSGYASKQTEDLMWTSHVAFRPVDINLGPDGAIYVADWYNPIIQHGEVDFYDPRRDQEHGRIWRIVAKNRPLVKTPKLSKAPVTELLAALTLPEDWTRSQAKQVLKDRGATEVIPALQKWVNALDKLDKNYEHNLLEALWVYQSLDTVNEPILLSLLNAKTHNARAAGLRALHLWNDKITNVPALLTKAASDTHPQVRLEAVIALRKLHTADAAKTALSVLDQPMDEFLDYALWETVRELEPQWTKRLKTEPGFFGNPKKTVFALKSVNSADAVGQLVTLYQQDQIPEEYRKDVLTSVARNGRTEDLNTVFDMAVKGNVSNGKAVGAQLASLEQAARQRNVKPSQDLNRISGFIQNDDDQIAASAVRLIGLWKLNDLGGKLVELTKTGDKNIKKAALFSLASMDKSNAEKVLTDIISGKNSTELKLLAAAQLVSVNVATASKVGVELLATLPPQTDASDLFQAFFTTRDGIGSVAKALMEKKIPSEIAKEARQAVQIKVRSGRQKDEDVMMLKKALEASGGTLPVERMPQQLSDTEITSIAKEIKSSANPQRGEMIFRKNGCFTCHAVGGAGGLIGPDLSSLGTSSPVETITRSILYPAISIKEGYELQRIAKKDGSEIMGYLVSNGSSEIVMRDVTGLEVAVPKSQIQVMEKIPGSLMPPGLTAGLDKQEFIDLIGFLSKLGESGQYRVPNTRFVRRWETVEVNAALAKKMATEGIGYVVKPNAKIPFSSAYSKVAGDIPVDELPVADLGAGRRYSFLRFEIEVLTKGHVNLGLNATTGVTAWDGQKPVKLTEKGIVADLSQGIHTITLAVDRSAFKDASLGIQLVEGEGTTAQTRLRMGR
jgi:putative heme-binding domain-containing protein